MAYEKEKEWVKQQLRAGKQIPRNAAFYQTLKRAEGNLPEVQAFMDSFDVHSHTY